MKLTKNSTPARECGCEKRGINYGSQIQIWYITSDEEKSIRMKILLHTVVVSTVVICALGWKNEWDGRLSFSCPSGQHISWVQSIHNNKKEDRRWDYG